MMPMPKQFAIRDLDKLSIKYDKSRHQSSTEKKIDMNILRPLSQYLKQRKFLGFHFLIGTILLLQQVKPHPSVE